MKYRVFTEADEHCNAAWCVLDEKNQGWVVYWRAPAEERTGRFAFLDDRVEDYEHYAVTGEFNYCSECGRKVVEP